MRDWFRNFPGFLRKFMEKSMETSGKIPGDFEKFLGKFRTIPGRFPEISRTCPGNFQKDTSRMLPGNAPEVIRKHGRPSRQRFGAETLKRYRTYRKAIKAYGKPIAFQT